MSSLAAYAEAATGILRRDMAVFFSYRFQWITQLLSTMFTLTLFFYISRLITVGDFDSPDQYFAFAVVGILSLEFVNLTIVMLPGLIRQELVAGTWERLVLSPFGPLWSVCSMVIFPLLWTMTQAAAMIGVAAIVFSLPLEGAQSLLAVPVAVLAALSFAPLGIMLAGIILLFKQAMGAGAWIVAGITIVAGFYFPVSLLPGWIEWTSDIQPFTPAVELMRNLIVGMPLSRGALDEVLVLVLFTAVLLPVSLWFLGKTIDISRKRGTIIEY